MPTNNHNLSLDKVEATTQWFDEREKEYEQRDLQAATDDHGDLTEGAVPWGDQCIYCGKDAYSCEHYEEPPYDE